jgi:signal transduction histidine kinase
MSDSRRLPSEVETALYRVIQEAIVNITRHAAARNVNISLNYLDDQVIAQVEDDGIGFDITQLALSPDSSRGLGLLGMEERLELLDGTLDINTMPGSGTSLHISIPLRERNKVYA